MRQNSQRRSNRPAIGYVPPKARFQTFPWHRVGGVFPGLRAGGRRIQSGQTSLTVNTSRLLALPLLASAALLSGCASRPAEARATNLNQPGPAIGHAVGSVGGAVTGQVAGAVVAGAQGAADAIKAPFNNERRVVRRWRTETTADGRTIQVPYEVEVDEHGRVIEPGKN